VFLDIGLDRRIGHARLDERLIDDDLDGEFLNTGQEFARYLGLGRCGNSSG